MSPLAKVTLAFSFVVVRVSVPAASSTQKVGAPQVAFTDSEVVVGSVLVLVYSTRTMSAWQTCTRRRPGLSVNVTPFASTTYEVPVGGAGHASCPPAPESPPP